MAEGIPTTPPGDAKDPLKAEETRPDCQSEASDSGSASLKNRHRAPHVPRVTPFPVPKETSPPILPKVKSSGSSDRRHASTPEFCMDLLQEIQQLLTNWQQELQKLHLQVEELYREGPMIDGWLESQYRQSRSDCSVTSLRHADIDELMAYIEQLSLEEDSLGDGREVTYQLCGLDESGKLWSKPCPVEQIPSVSIAIARYQKVRQLLKRKQSLERKITQLAEGLIVCQTNVQEKNS